MLTTFATISPHIRFTRKLVSITNLAFKFHYRATFLLLLVCTILVTSRQYIGEHIRCLTGGSPTIPEHVMNTFCYFTTTFTVVRHFNETLLQLGVIPHPGVGPVRHDEVVQHHAYYQWVPFFLFAKAICFYLPYLFWKNFEGGKIKALVEGLQMISLGRYIETGEDLTIRATGVKIPCPTTIDGKVSGIRVAFRQHIEVNRCWAIKYVFCEILNAFNLLLMIYATNRFLAGHFYDLGIHFWNEDFRGIMDVLDFVFPKVTKCNFYKYGPSGSIQKHDVLCVMALNVMNEKIFTFLWFWYAFLMIVTGCAMLWRLITIIFHSRSSTFNRYVFLNVCPGRLNIRDMETVSKHFAFSDWLFLYYLAKNMEPVVFSDMLILIAKELRGEIEDDNDSPASSDGEEEPETKEDEAKKDPILTVEDEQRQNLLNNRVAAAGVRTVFLLNEDEKNK